MRMRVALVRTIIADWVDRASRAIDSLESTPRNLLAYWLDKLSRAIDSKEPM